MNKYNRLLNSIDTLKEVGNIGAGNAATALSLILNKPVNMAVAQVNVKEIDELVQVLGDEENYIAAMLIEVYGDIQGMLILAFEVECAITLVGTILNKEPEALTSLEEIDHSVLCETGNILAGHYLNALSQLTGMYLNYSVPQIAMDMASAILSYPATTYGTNNSAMLLIETAFTDCEKILDSKYFLILNEEEAENIVKSLEKLL